MFVLKKRLDDAIERIKEERELRSEAADALQAQRVATKLIERDLIKAKNDLAESEAKCQALADEIQKLVKIVNAKNGGCKEGPWCDGCKHKIVSRIDYTFKKEELINGPEKTVETTGFGTVGDYTICKKQVQGFCSEFEETTLPPLSLGFGCAPVK